MSASNFNYWKNEIADMPTQGENGGWYDLETGIAYDDAINYHGSSKPRKQASEKTLASRKVAKKFGGKALKGSAKQKIWGEDIRAAIISECPESVAQTLCDPKGIAQHAKFWIEHRTKTAQQFIDFITEQASMLAQFETLAEKKDRFALAAKLHELKSPWIVD